MSEVLSWFDRMRPFWPKILDIAWLTKISVTEPDDFIELQNAILCYLYDNRDYNVTHGQGLSETEIAGVVNCHCFLNQALFRLYEKQYITQTDSFPANKFEITPEGQIYLRRHKIRPA